MAKEKRMPKEIKAKVAVVRALVWTLAFPRVSRSAVLQQRQKAKAPEAK